MSTDWDVFCTECNNELGLYDNNHGDDLCRALIRNRAALEIMGEGRALIDDRDVGERLIVHLGRFNVDVSFFSKHKGHELRPRSEYGELDGTCGKRINCKCGTSHHCHRPINHTEECDSGDGSGKPLP